MSQWLFSISFTYWGVPVYLESPFQFHTMNEKYLYIIFLNKYTISDFDFWQILDDFCRFFFRLFTVFPLPSLGIYISTPNDLSEYYSTLLYDIHHPLYYCLMSFLRSCSFSLVPLHCFLCPSTLDFIRVTHQIQPQWTICSVSCMQSCQYFHLQCFLEMLLFHFTHAIQDKIFQIMVYLK